MEINRRVINDNSNLSYDKGGMAIKPYQHKLILPEIFNPTKTIRYLVFVLFRIKEDGTLHDLAIETNNKTHIHYKDAYYTNDPDFEKEAITLINNSGKWHPFSKNGNYVDREQRTPIFFEYHPLYLMDPASMILNPEIKAKFIGDQELLYRMTNPTMGYDGETTFLAIIETDGRLTNEYCVSIIGKTNEKIGLHSIKNISEWEPAREHGIKVRSFIKLTLLA